VPIGIGTLLVVVVVRGGELGEFPSPRERPGFTGVLVSTTTRDADENDAVGEVKAGEGVFPISVSILVEIGN
jgi:hypothetical protein